MEHLETQVKTIIQSELSALNRADLFRSPLISFASAHDPEFMQLKTKIGTWHLHPTELLPTANTVISYFVPFTKDVAVAPKSTTQGSALWGESYVVINEWFAHINECVCNYLIGAGYEAATIPATHTYDPKDMHSMWSHRSAAAIAGLGAFAANRLLITDKGSAGRFCTVLTSATLPTEHHTPVDRCLYHKNGSCGLCFAACPVNALKPDSLDKFACQDVTQQNKTRIEQNANLKEADICGRCISVCPFAYIE